MFYVSVLGGSILGLGGWGFGLQDLGSGVWGSEFWVWGFRFGVWVQGWPVSNFTKRIRTNTMTSYQMVSEGYVVPSQER